MHFARTLAVLEKHPSTAATTARPAGVPFLFAIDSELGIEDGRVWREEDVERLRRGSSYADGGGGCGGSDGGDASCATGCGASCGGGGG